MPLPCQSGRKLSCKELDSTNTQEKLTFRPKMIKINILRAKLATSTRVVYEPKSSSKAWLTFSELIRSSKIKPSDLYFSREISVQYWRPTRLRTVQTTEMDKNFTAMRNIYSSSTKTKVPNSHESKLSIILHAQNPIIQYQ